jgi:L-asparaginase
MANQLVFLGTGGTIAGAANQASDNVNYRAGERGIASLLAAVAPLGVALGDWEAQSEQVAQLDSKDMNHALWSTLAQRIHFYLAQTDVAAIVVTHGTDTLEETAFFLSQVLPSEWLCHKPVVLTCAMRPATSFAPDGPQNLLDAVAVARNRSACGVLVVCAGKVHSARDVQKVHPYRLDAFDSGDAGILGVVEEGQVRWLHAAREWVAERAAVTWQALFPLPWPQVEVVMSYAGVSGKWVRAVCLPTGCGERAIDGLVVAGTGNGTIHEDLENALRDAQARGVRVVRVSRCAFGSVVVGTAEHEFANFAGLSAVKARIALMLDLMVQRALKKAA